MANSKNFLKVDFQDNPELKALFQNWKVGESYTFKIQAQLNSMDDQGAEMTVEEVTAEEPDAETGEPETTVEPDRTSPVMMTMGSQSTGAGY